jgi:hypothetical protein
MTMNNNNNNNNNNKKQHWAECTASFIASSDSQWHLWEGPVLHTAHYDRPDHIIQLDSKSKTIPIAVKDPTLSRQSAHRWR